MSTAIARIPVSNRQQDERLLADAAALVGMGAWSCDLATERLEWTDGVFNLFGLEREWNPDRRAAVELYCEPYRDQLETLRSEAIRTGAGFSMDAQICRPNGDLRWMRLVAATEVSNGRAVRIYGMKQDITDDKREWERLRRLAENDALTGLANRARFHSHFLDLAVGSAALSAIGAIALFDLNDFKTVNDEWGHAAGDYYLAHFGERLAAAFPQALMVARIGGDEFAVVLPSSLSPDATESLVRNRMDALAAPVRRPEWSLPLGFSVGLAFNCAENRVAPDTLFVAADAALYAAKRSGRTKLHVAPWRW